MKKTAVLLLILCCIQMVASAATDYTFAIEPIYTSAGDFNIHGLATVTDESGRAGVIDAAGNPIFGFDGTEFCLRKNGLIMALGENEMAAFFDSNGKRLTEYIYDVYKQGNPEMPHDVRYCYLTNKYDGDGNSDLVPISRDKKFGYINSAGIEVIPPTYEYVYGFYNGVSRTGAMGDLSAYGTYINGKYGYINESGEVLYPADSLWSADDFTDDFAQIADGEIKLIDKRGNQIDVETGEYLPYQEEYGLILAHLNEKTAVFDRYGRVIVEGDWRRKELFRGSIIIENKQLIGSNGRVLYEAPEGVFIMRSPYGDINFRCITKNITDTETVSGLINPKGEMIFPCEYNNIRELGEGLIYAENYKGKNIIYNERGRELCTLNGKVLGEPCVGLLPVLDFDTMLCGYIRYPIKVEGEKSAAFLYNLGLFKGVSETEGKPDFALEKEATRPEALVMLIRVLGKDAEAQSYPKTHPFTDVPQWVDGYVSYAYDNGIAKGIADTAFGVKDVTEAEYLTFMLRALGYYEEEGYTWDNPYSFATLKGIQNNSAYPFLRSAMADITYHALYAKINNTDACLWERLEREGAIKQGLVPAEKLPTKTYAEALEELTPNDAYVILGMLEADACTVVQSCIMGAPHGANYVLRLVYKPASSLGEGTVISLPLPPSNGWGVNDSPDELYLSDDKSTLYYTIYSLQEVGAMFEEYTVLREKGTYRYTVNLETGEVMLHLEKQTA